MYKVKVLVELDIDDDEYFEDCSDTSEKKALIEDNVVGAYFGEGWEGTNATVKEIEEV